jgi:hypothetical protein
MKIVIYPAGSKQYKTITDRFKDAKHRMSDTIHIEGYNYTFDSFDNDTFRVNRDNASYLVGFVEDPSDSYSKVFNLVVREVLTTFPLTTVHQAVNQKLGSYGLVMRTNVKIEKLEKEPDNAIKSKLEEFKRSLDAATKKLDSATDYLKEVKEAYDKLIRQIN